MKRFWRFASTVVPIVSLFAAASDARGAPAPKTTPAKQPKSFQPPEPGTPKVEKVDLAKFPGDQKEFVVSAAGPVRIEVANAYRSCAFRDQVLGQLHHFREQLELGVEHPEQRVRNDVWLDRIKKARLHPGRTIQLYEQAKRTIAAVARDEDALWKQALGIRGERAAKQMGTAVFAVTPDPGVDKRIRLYPCYRPEDLRQLTRVLVRACGEYIARVDEIEKQLRREQAARKRRAAQLRR